MALSLGRHDDVSVPGRTTTQDEAALTVNTRTSADPYAGGSRCGIAAAPLNNPRVDVADLLTRAASMVPADVVNEAGVTVMDVREYLDHDEWEVALDLLADLDTGWRPPTAWWDLLIDSAEVMWLSDAAAWCRWGRWESIHGIVRAELRLLSPTEGGRGTPIPGKGILRPLWDLGRLTAAGNPDARGTRLGGVRASVATKRHRFGPPGPTVPRALASPAAGHDDHHARGPAHGGNGHHYRGIECALTSRSEDTTG
ncbi:hypothetical protein [Micromonospora zamorensis]|uniref:hypothetical protein n=1 Tax=Micromonospora zamorensis TaxID=709883 RepID=UPI0033DC2135